MNQATKIQLMGGNSKAPNKGSPVAAGFGFFSSQGRTINPFSQAKIPTGIKIQLHEGAAGESSIVLTQRTKGEVKVCLINNTNKCIRILEDTCIAQIIMEKKYEPSLEIVEEFDEIERGSSGFGSTGEE